MKCIYEKATGNILTIVSDDTQTIDGLYFHYPQEYKDGLDFIKAETFPKNIRQYRVVNNNIVSKSDLEIYEEKAYGKILKADERDREKLKPDGTEVEKAEKIIDVLDILQDVGLIKLADTALIDAKLIDAYTSLFLSGAYVLSESDRIGINQKLVPTKYKIEVNTKVTEKTNKEK